MCVIAVGFAAGLLVIGPLIVYLFRPRRISDMSDPDFINVLRDTEERLEQRERSKKD